MDIHQLNVTHNDRQDRLLVRVNTANAQEFRFWLTRRMTLLLMPALRQSLGRLESSVPHRLASEPASMAILTELQHEAFLQQADFETPYQEPPVPAQMAEPMLVTHAHLQLLNQQVKVTLEDQEAPDNTARQCTLNLTAPLLHGWVHLIEKAVGVAGWQNTPETQEMDAQSTPLVHSGYRH
jgi:hypothetical protein